MYFDPIYDVRDLDEDGAPDNPGSILFEKPVRTGQKDTYNTSIGLSATLSWPLDGNLQDQCKEAARVQTELNAQIVANKRLDFEIARLKNCGTLMQQGIQFHPKSPYYKICADVVVNNPPGHKHPHTHAISSTPSSKSAVPSSDPAGQVSSPDVIQPSLSSRVSQKSSLQPSSSQASPPSKVNPPGVLPIGQMSLPQQQSLR